MNLFWNKYFRNYVLYLLQMRFIRRGQVLCVCWGGAQYNCNPRAIVDQMCQMGLLKSKDSRFEVCFAFWEPKKFQHLLPQEVHAIEIGSYDYYKTLATSQFVISNTRFGGGMFWPMPKRRHQIYIQTMHGGHGIKKIEHDANLSADYLKVADEDTRRTDLMLSDSRYWTHIYRTAFRYAGEVLEEGLPRNDVFFKPRMHRTDGKRFLIYTPTFRNNGRRDVYGFDYDRVIAALETRFGGEWYIRISSHPNMQGFYREIYDFSHPRLIDVGGQELQHLLCSSDALITDYSSAAMDFSLTQRPVFQLCPDRKDYDRGFYIQPEKLPFPYAETDDQLVQNILQFNEKQYQQALEKFNEKIIGLKETGHASEAVVAWMLEHLMK